MIIQKNKGAVIKGMSNLIDLICKSDDKIKSMINDHLTRDLSI